MFKYVLFIVLILGFNGCFDKEPEEIKIGFVAGLSGKYSNLGTSIRDGFILAFDEIDNNINGQKIKIIQKDDKQNKEEAKKAINYFIKNNIKLIVGNGTSSMTKVSLPIINKHKDSLMLSVTASSSDFTGLDDNFLRIQVNHSAKIYEALNQYIIKNKYKKVFFIYDSNNLSYTKGYTGFFQDMIIQNGGDNFVGNVDLNLPYKDIIKKIKAVENDLILVVGNSVDSANFIQYLRVININQKVLITGWAKTIDFITNGGKAVDGCVVSSEYDEQSKDKQFITFVDKFKKKYKKEPSVFAAQGYEMAQILIQNLKDSTDIATLKQRILKIKKYNGLQGNIIFDKYGDVFREYFMMEVKNNKFRKIN
ncbi:MAG: ABC transporter substrate-binding protein [Arcobacteraceae bacterium]|nr:ABC transporter substrate-binding protein [Arcobacteraceae bacterium]